MDDISQREQGKNQGLKAGGRGLRKGGQRSKGARRAGAQKPRVEFQGVKSSDIRHREVKQDKDGEVPIVLGN